MWSEHHFVRGIEHGIAREWNDQGRLRRGSPTYWLHGKQVLRRVYERATKTDALLPPIRRADDRPVPVINVAELARTRDVTKPFQMYSRDSSGAGSSIVSEGGCTNLSTPSGSLSSGC
ncbi:MAG: hypothetical protein H0T42_09765 [Deltaproteobacteria bacterium]|nr:hypothetical protein [Deltaproteobacteria bacterium]